MLDLTKFEGHTPGRWFNDGEGYDKINGGGHKTYRVASQCGVGICIVVLPDEDRSDAADYERRATRRLIAAAPDLLAEVRRLRSLCDELACDLGKISDQLAATNGGAA